MQNLHRGSDGSSLSIRRDLPTNPVLHSVNISGLSCVDSRRTTQSIVVANQRDQSQEEQGEQEKAGPDGDVHCHKYRKQHYNDFEADHPDLEVSRLRHRRHPSEPTDRRRQVHDSAGNS